MLSRVDFCVARERRRSLLIAIVAACSFAATPAFAVSLGFHCITANTPGDCPIAEAQLLVDVTDPGGGQVLFTFKNVGADDVVITDIYFDDGSLLGISSLINDPPNVAFSVPAIPSELPSANLASPTFVTTMGFSADSDPPPAQTGVDPGEELGIIFDLVLLKDFSDVLAELESGSLRIGIHAQGFASGGSESLVNDPIPEPGTGLLMALGLTLLAARGRRASSR